MGAILHQQQRRRQFGLVAQQPGALPFYDLRWTQETRLQELRSGSSVGAAVTGLGVKNEKSHGVSTPGTMMIAPATSSDSAKPISPASNPKVTGPTSCAAAQ